MISVILAELGSLEIILFALAGVAIYVSLIRWVFMIDKQMKNQQKQLDILAAIAKKIGVEETALPK